MRRISTLSAQILFTVILAALPMTVCTAGGSSQDKALLAAHDAFLAGDRVRLARHAEKIQAHALDIYVSFWRLRLRLEEADPGEVRAFLV
jgi:soluble lytic murein transglycosylase